MWWWRKKQFKIAHLDNWVVKHTERLEKGSNWWISFDYGGGTGGEVSGKGPCVVIVLEQKEEK